MPKMTVASFVSRPFVSLVLALVHKERKEVLEKTGLLLIQQEKGDFVLLLRPPKDSWDSLQLSSTTFFTSMFYFL